MTDCAEGLPWPVLDRVRMLGLPGKIDEGSVTFEIMTPGKIHPLRSIPVKASKVARASITHVPSPPQFHRVHSLPRNGLFTAHAKIAQR